MVAPFQNNPSSPTVVGKALTAMELTQIHTSVRRGRLSQNRTSNVRHDLH